MLTGSQKVRTTKRVPAAASGLRFAAGNLIVSIDDGREVRVPLHFYPTLERATPSARKQWELIGDGRGISWEALDLDLSVEALLAGAREGIPKPPMLVKQPRKVRNGRSH
jgi:Protein of unknown function (DUF2442)